MPTIDERIAQNEERAKQLKRQKKEQEAREKKRQLAIDRDRHRIIGKIVSEIFPEVLRFNPSRVNAENQNEFAPLVDFLTELAADKDLITRLKERTIQKMTLLNQ